MQGIYKILCLPEDRVYIGSSSEITRRWQKHIRTLNNQTHHNYKLQLDWDCYGDESFVFEVLEETNNLIEREKFWLNKIFEGSYNIHNSSNNPMRDAQVKQKRLETIYAKYGNMSGGFAKLNDSLVTEIINLINTGGSNPEIAKKYDCHISTIRAIRMKESWKHLSHLLIDTRTPKERKKQQVEDLYKQGIDRITIWTSTGIPRTTVISWIAEIEKRKEIKDISS